MLEKLGLCKKWINRILACLTSIFISILVNDCSTGEFRPGKGIRQENPLAPFFFLIVSGGLAKMIRQTKKLNMLQGVKVGSTELEICMLQYADDIIFICENNHQNVNSLKVVLVCFKVISRLKINFHKSKIGGIGISD